MARNEHLIRAPAEAVFDVLADPRGYAYWVIGSREIRAADDSWPEPDSRFKHTVNAGPLRIKDESLVDVDGGTRVTMIEDPADLLSAFVFQPLVHLITRWRNLWSLQRLAELAEGRVPRPGEEAEAPSQTPDGDGSVVNPRLHGRGDGRRGAVPAVASGLGAGLAGALTMSASTDAEMRLRGRPASDAPRGRSAACCA